jgi:hypothetical protein
MSQWSERIRGLPIWQQFEALGPAIDQAESREGLDPTTVEGLGRLRTVLTFLGKRAAAIDPLLVHPGPLENAAAALQNAVTEVQQFVTDGNPARITNANAHADAALANVAQVNVPLGPRDLQALKDAADAYRATMEGNIRQSHSTITQFRSDAEALKTKLNELTTEMAAERQRLTTVVSDFQSQFSAAQDSRSKEYTAAEKASQTKLTDILSDYTKRLADQDAEFKRQGEKLAKDHETVLETLKVTQAGSAKVILDEMLARKQEIENLVGVIGNLGVTSGYLKTANEAKMTLRIWQGIAVISMITLIGVAYFTFMPVAEGTFTWAGFAGRVFFSVTIGVLAAYAASQADKFMEVERRNRKLALELEALGPFLAPLPEGLQQDFRLKVGDRSFGQEEAGLSGKSDKSPATAIDVLLKSKEIRELAVELVKAYRKG